MMPPLGPFREAHPVEQMTEICEADVGIRGPLKDLEEQFLVPVHQGIIRSSWFEKYAFVEAYRTLCIAPTPEVRAVFHDLRQLKLAG